MNLPVRKIVLSIVEGSNVRNILEMGFLEALRKEYPDTRFCLVTPASNIKAFTDRWSLDQNIEFHKFYPHRPGAKQKRMANLRRKAVKLGLGFIANGIRNMERKLLYKGAHYKELLQDADLLICSHVHLPLEQELANQAYHLKVPCLGLLNSWDNVYKGVETHVDFVGVWNSVNYSEMISMEGYSEQELFVSGIPAFMPYFDSENQLERAEFCQKIGFDPNRPIVTYASIGQFVPFFEETFILEEILSFVKKYDTSSRPQVICRLHPWSKKELFSHIEESADVYFSGFSNYIPTLNWAPTYEEVVFAGNLLKHSDICISPGSTMSIEAPIFDTPVIVPVYNAYQPEIWKDYYSRFCMAMHFGKLVQNGYSKIVTSTEAFEQEFKAYLDNPKRDQEMRKKLVKDYVGPVDNPIKSIIEASWKLLIKHNTGKK